MRLKENKLNQIIKQSVKKVLNEADRTYETQEDYYETFYEYMLKANDALHSALSFCGSEMGKDPIVKNARKAFDLLNWCAYFIQQRRQR